MQIQIVRHFGLPFFNNAHARLLATGALYHVVILYDLPPGIGHDPPHQGSQKMS